MIFYQIFSPAKLLKAKAIPKYIKKPRLLRAGLLDRQKS